ncbi:hypothetical protein HDV00_002370 [Rhizophlyctis rosea]|nr:hypothetical protein HDV00_002370 [Rhizophlyctis rosea]
MKVRNPHSLLDIGTFDTASALTRNHQSDQIWSDDAQRAIASQKRLSQVTDMLKEYDSFQRRAEDAKELLPYTLRLLGSIPTDLAQEENDAGLLDDVTSDLTALEENLDRYTFKLLMSEEADQNGCFIELRAGSGGTESQDWVQIIMRMYEKWGLSQDFEVKIVDELKGEVAGLKSATLQMTGEYAYGWCKNESGIHRFVRISPFDSNSKRHTSFISVQVYPSFEASNSSMKDIELPPGDLKIETMRAQGAGGQHVNKTESAIRITHVPTGITVSCQTERSQHMNRATAMQMLKAKLYQKELQAQAQARADQHAGLADMSWGSQIRSYVMQPYQMIKDLRTGYERGDVQNVLDGDLSGYMEAALAWRQKKT